MSMRPSSPIAIAIALGLPLGMGTVACSSNKSTQGELVLALQTDLSLPKDVDKVRIEISQLGTLKFGNTYDVGWAMFHLFGQYILYGDTRTPIGERCWSREACSDLPDAPPERLPEELP